MFSWCTEWTFCSLLHTIQTSTSEFCTVVQRLVFDQHKDLHSWENFSTRKEVYFFAKETFHWGLNLYCWLAGWWLTAGVGGLCFVLLCTFKLFLVLNCLPQSSQATTSPTCVSMWFLMFCLTWPSLPQTRHCSSPLSVCPVRLSILLSNLAAYPSGSSSWPIRCKRWLQSRPTLKLCGCCNIVTCVWQMRLFSRLDTSERKVKLVLFLHTFILCIGSWRLGRN